MSLLKRFFGGRQNTETNGKLSDTFARIVKEHLDKIKNMLPSNDQSANWTRSVIKRIADKELDQICLLASSKMDQSLDDKNRHSASFLIDDLFVSISTFPCDVEEARQKYYSDGYLIYMDNMINMGRQQNENCHWLHFQFFWDGHIFWVQFTLFPNKKVLTFKPTYQVPPELLSAQEKSALGL